MIPLAIKSMIWMGWFLKWAPKTSIESILNTSANTRPLAVSTSTCPMASLRLICSMYKIFLSSYVSVEPVSNKKGNMLSPFISTCTTIKPSLSSHSKGYVVVFKLAFELFLINQYDNLI
jgi:hypothetical protein